MGRLQLVVVFMVFIQCSRCTPQGRLIESGFKEVSKNEISDLTVNFGVNRARFKNYSWMAAVSNETHRFFAGSKDSFSEIGILCCESTKTKSLRRDMRTTTYKLSEIEPGSWETVFSINGKARRILASTEVSADVAFRGSMVPSDPWNWAISCQSAVEHGLAAPTYWSELLDSEKLVAAEKLESPSESIYRGEWKFGKNSKSRLMILFSSTNEGMPFYCRYHIPEDPTVAFSTKSKVYCEEIAIEWKKVADGWAPSRVRNHKDSFDEEGKLMSIKSLDTKFTWGPSADRIEHVFDPMVVAPDQLVEIISVFKPKELGKSK